MTTQALVKVEEERMKGLIQKFPELVDNFFTAIRMEEYAKTYSASNPPEVPPGEQQEAEMQAG